MGGLCDGMEAEDDWDYILSFLDYCYYDGVCI